MAQAANRPPAMKNGTFDFSASSAAIWSSASGIGAGAYPTDLPFVARIAPVPAGPPSYRLSVASTWPW